MDSPQQTRTAIAGLRPLVHATRAGQLDDSTPCDQWAVRDLLNHLVGGGYMFAMSLNGEALDMSAAPADLLGSDHAAAFDASIAAFNEALDRATDLSAMVTLPFGSVPADLALRVAAADLLVHSWDLAKATGQQFDPPVDFVESVSPFYHEFVQPPLRQMGLFAEAVDIPDDASALDKLVAYAGRKP
jgi:uncharacterized protein (TIGR03086 family)